MPDLGFWPFAKVLPNPRSHSLFAPRLPHSKRDARRPPRFSATERLSRQFGTPGRVPVPAFRGRRLDQCLGSSNAHRFRLADSRATRFESNSHYRLPPCAGGRYSVGTGLPDGPGLDGTRRFAGCGGESAARLGGTAGLPAVARVVGRPQPGARADSQQFLSKHRCGTEHDRRGAVDVARRGPAALGPTKRGGRLCRGVGGHDRPLARPGQVPSSAQRGLGDLAALDAAGGVRRGCGVPGFVPASVQVAAFDSAAAARDDRPHGGPLCVWAVRVSRGVAHGLPLRKPLQPGRTDALHV